MQFLIELLYWTAFVGLGIQALGALCLIRFYFQKVRVPANWGPNPAGISVLKPCHTNQDGEAANFEGFFHQDYPGPWELIFVVSTLKAPIVPIIEALIARYPNVQARLVVSTTQRAAWRKVDALYDGHQTAQHEIILWSDSDAIVRPNYLSEMAAALREPGVSVVTVPQYDTRINNFATAFKVLGNTCDLSTYVMIELALARNQLVGWGHSMAFKRKEFDSFPEAWDTLNTFLADDLALPYIFVNNGKKVVSRNIYCPVEFASKTLKQVVDQKRRWVWCQRIFVGNRWVYLSAILFYPQIVALFLVLLTGFSTESLLLFGAVAATRIGIFALHESLFLRSLRMTLSYFWTLPLWDISQLFFVWDGFRRKHIEFNGKPYRVVNRYFLEPLQTPVDSL